MHSPNHPKYLFISRRWWGCKYHSSYPLRVPRHVRKEKTPVNKTADCQVTMDTRHREDLRVTMCDRTVEIETTIR